jgi:phosphate uptake regulator
MYRIGGKKNMYAREMSEELRKIQLTGGSTYIISLPKTWIDRMGLGKGSIVSINQNSGMSLTIRPSDYSPIEKIRKVILTTDQGDKPESIIRNMVSSYLRGYNIIQIRSTEKRFDPELRFYIKNFVRKKLIGTEILSDLHNELTLQILLSYAELSVKDALKRMSIIAASMHRDAVQTLSNDNPGIAKEVLSMDDEVDRFSFYVTRLLSAAIIDAQILKKSGITNQQQCLEYKLITKSVERIADHATNIADNRLALNFVLINEEILTQLNRISQSAIAVFEAAIEALINDNYSAADKVIYSAEETRSMENEVIQKIVKFAPVEDVPMLRLIVESIMRTAEYGADIAETVLNMTISDAAIEE